MSTKVIGGKIPPKEHRKLHVEDALDNIFERIVFARLHSRKQVRDDCQFMPEQMGPMWANVPSEKSDIQFSHPKDVNAADLVWPLNVGLITHKRESDEWGNHINCNYWQSTPAKLLRGKYRFYGRKNIGWFTGNLLADRSWVPAVNYGAWHMGGWRKAQRIRYDEAFMSGISDAGTARLERYVSTGEEDIGRMCALGQSIGLTYRYEWGAQFSIGDSAKVIVPTTPKGVLELFNDRNKPEDRDRRAALRHWVSQHRRRKSGEDFSNVRAHLRGETSFSWRGFDVTIRPSAFDTEQAASMTRTQGEADE